MYAPRKVPILTVFAGPNGSGKSTLVARLLSEGKFGVLVNADDIAKSIAVRKGEAAPSQETQWEAAISAEEMRWALLSQRIEFMTETVMSDGDRWLKFFAAAKSAGYRIVLYFVTTRDPRINVQRVRERVQAGGHDVDPVKIRRRYKKTMKNLPAVLGYVDEAVLFDNSDPNTGLTGVLIVHDGRSRLLIDEADAPPWLSHLLTLIEPI